MQYFLNALGLVLLLEGAVYALFPQAMKKFLSSIHEMTPVMLRSSGLLLAIIGATIIYFVTSV